MSTPIGPLTTAWNLLISKFLKMEPKHLALPLKSVYTMYILTTGFFSS